MKHKIVIKKLGRENAYGLADDEKNIITIDPRLRPKKHLEILIHEKLHLLEHGWSEKKVTKTARELRDLLWNAGYRFVKL